ncbi:MAG: PD-(D/E)XK nuclease family protein [Muribaculaceae bacterium]|nr:PD-(D/E)XK nuclease family protein [Muribaculaceae bacterium]
MKADLTDHNEAQSKSFLGIVARAYASRYREMSNICFLFPNKRSGTFFLKHLSDAIGSRVMLAPEVLGVNDFMEQVSGLRIVSRIDALFRLYKLYRRRKGMPESISTPDDALDFDRFAPWGETVLMDFNEVDKYDIDADAIFRNVVDYRNLSANFLTDGQIEVIERYFGYKPRVSDVERFWKSVHELPGDTQESEDGELSLLKRKFLELWELLPELYRDLRTDLEADGLALEGTAYRCAMRRVLGGDYSTLGWDRVVLVGFNTLSTSELKLLRELTTLESDDGEQYVDFVWDATGPVLCSESDGPWATHNPAAAAMARLMKAFPMPDWIKNALEECSVSEFPQTLTESAAPSNAAQVKVASMKVEEWIKLNDGRDVEEAKTAIVLPDPSLLMPLVHSLPENLESVNITMGYSLKYTAVASFIHHLRRIQSRVRRMPQQSGEYGYYHEDLRIFLSHPLTHRLIGGEIAKHIINSVAERHINLVPLRWIEKQSAEAKELLEPLLPTTSALETLAYIDGVLSNLFVALSRQEGELAPEIKGKIESQQVDRYRKAVAQLQASVEGHGVEMHFSTLFRLVENLVGSETIAFKGEPLKGLQIMGLLETRALDFERVAILSMNDKVMPRRARKRTFIPDSLRRGYGLPLTDHAEELYSYYFYRLISRAREVTMIYDSRAGEGMRSGGKSRFLLQLELLHARDAIKRESYAFMLEPVISDIEPIKKNREVMKRLAAFLTPEERRKRGIELPAGVAQRSISASALANYCKCPIKFYYKNVVRVDDAVSHSDHIDRITHGNVVHHVMQNLYVRDEHKRGKWLGKHPVVITADELKAIYDDEPLIEREVRRAVNLLHFHRGGNHGKERPEELDTPLTGSVSMEARKFVEEVRWLIEHDASLAAVSPLKILGVEAASNIEWKAGPTAPEVQVRYVPDRIDIAEGRMRIIDYKTGSTGVQASAIEEIFDGAKSAKNILQLQLYAGWLSDHEGAEIEEGKHGIRTEIYKPSKLADGEISIPAVAKRACNTHLEIKEEFDAQIERTVAEIFNPEVDFRGPARPEDACTYCTFRMLCGRNKN